MTGPCDDLRIIDLSSGQASGIATMILADFGADVIKVEPPGGDPARALPAAPMWLRGKRSVTLDLETTAGRAALSRLAEGADVVVASYAPGQAAKHGADYETLSARNPGLVYCSITGWGPRGPLAGHPADEYLVAAKSGRMWAFQNIVRRPGHGFPAVQVGAHGASQSAVAGILAALEVRARTGAGQLVETSLLQGMFPFDLNTLIREQLLARYPELAQNDMWARYQSPDMMPTLGYHPLVASDGRWIQLANLLEHLFQSSIVALGLTEEVLANPRYAGAPNALDDEAREEVRNLMLQRARERTADEWMAAFRENGNVAADYVGTAQQGLYHDDLVANGEVIELDHPHLGRVRQLGPLAQLRKTPAAITASAPDPGQHTDEVLAEPPRPRPATNGAHATNGASSAAPLAGITVLEFATIIAAPLGASLLGDLGARVIKVEPTDGGDPMRGMGGVGITAHMSASKTTASKESICIDLKSEEGREIVRKLLVNADVIVHNYRPGVPERLGIGYEQACEVKPDIIWVSVSGYGPDGPSATRPAAHPIPGAVNGGAMMQAGAGWPPSNLDSLESWREGARQFFRANEANPDPNTSVVVAAATTLALHARRRTGEGQQVFVSMLGANAYANSDDFLSYEGKPDRPQIDAMLFGIGPLRRLYQTSGDGWVCLSIGSDEEWRRLCETAGRPHLAADTRFKDGDAREQNADALTEELAALFATRTADEWERDLLAARVGCVRADEYANAGQFFLRSEHVKANGFGPVVDHRVLGSYQRWGPLVTFSKTPGRYGSGVLAGQHTDELLLEAGYDDTEIADLRGRAVVWSDEQPVPA
jgi:crotonobetainyl-CoA:carnitine CoA-transferase CaiB-like acyl-CoA transferase